MFNDTPMQVAQRKLGYITPAEAARVYKVPAQTLYSWIKRGQVAYKKIGMRRYFVNVAALRKLIGMTDGNAA
jgi:excisionase family DNA binding protein